MTKEELLKPRYEVIADYPDYTGSKYIHKKGDIIVFDDDNNVILWKEPGSDGTQCDHGHFMNYPNIFGLLEWWEQRKPEEMPEYLIWTDNKTVTKPHRFNGSYFFLSDDDGFGYHLGHTRPATKEDYDKFTGQK